MSQDEEFIELDFTMLYEGVEVEAKLARGKDGQGALPKSLWDSYSAFANTRGGVLLLGVKEEEGRELTPVGVGNPKKLVRDFWNSVQNPSTVNVNVLSEQDMSIQEHDGVHIVVINVPQAGRSQRPVYKGTNPFQGTYKRLDDGDYKCTEEEVRRMIAEAGSQTQSDRILEHSSIEDLDMGTVRRFRLRLRDTKPEHPFLNGDDVEFLHHVQALRTDRRTNERGVTLSGLLMFGKHSSILEYLPDHFLDYQEYLDEGLERWSHRVCSDGSWSGNLYDFYIEVVRRLHAGVQVPFQLTEGLWRQDETNVHGALREALANCLSHADHEGRGGLVIKRTSDRYVFSNPGRLRLPVETIMAGRESDPRNPILHKCFLLVGIAERSGVGMFKILRAWSEQDWHRPVLQEELAGQERTILTLDMMSLLPEEAVEAVEQLIGAAQFAGLTPEQRAILITAYMEDAVDHGRMKQDLDLHSQDLTRAFQKLLRRGFLEIVDREGSVKYALRARTDSSQSADEFSQSSGDVSQSAGEPSQSSPKLSKALPMRLKLRRRFDASPQGQSKIEHGPNRRGSNMRSWSFVESLPSH